MPPVGTSVLVDEYSFCSVPIELFCLGHSIAHATGFFWKQKRHNYLITNWHVLSGREPENGKSKNVDCALPDRVRVPMWRREDFKGNYFVDFPLKDATGSNLWLEHPQLGRKVDVAAIRIARSSARVGFLSEPLDVYPINSLSDCSNMAISVGSDVFILGFPLGMRTTGVLPIWKRGSVATKFDYPVKNLPCFLIDTATREGMSGSPVIQRSNGAFVSISGTFELGRGKTTRFLGIYSGRYIGRDVQEAQLGIVWKQELIEAVLVGQKRGNSEL